MLIHGTYIYTSILHDRGIAIPRPFTLNNKVQNNTLACYERGDRLE